MQAHSDKQQVTPQFQWGGEREIYGERDDGVDMSMH